MWTILKYGGSSLTLNGFNNIIKRIEQIDEGEKVIIVLSAIKGVTDLLLGLVNGEEENLEKILEIHYNFMKELKLEVSFDIKMMLEEIEQVAKDDKRKAITYGELLSTNILSYYLGKNNIKNQNIYAGKFIRADMENTENEIFLNCKYEGKLDIFNNLINQNIIITQGFMGNTPSGKACLLGRGGSDTSASLIASMLNAKVLEIWTDVDGMYTADPNKIKHASVIENIGYIQAQELAAMGAKVLHPYCIIPCQNKNIPIKIRNTHNPCAKINTTITNKKNYTSNLYAITDQNNVTVFNIKSPNMWNNYGFVYHIFEIFSNLGVDINIITTSQFIISATTDDRNINKLLLVKYNLEKTYEVEMKSKCSIISVVGDNVKTQHYFPEAIGISKKYKNIIMIHYSSNDLSLSFVLPSINSYKLLNELHSNLIGSIEPTNDENNINKKWWYSQINNIKEITKTKGSVYLYDLKFIENKISLLQNNLPRVNKIFYAMKANNHQLIIKKIAELGIGFECVSIEEVIYLREQLNINNQIIFTPNFCTLEEYVKCFNLLNVKVIVDNIEIIQNNPGIFENKEIGLRVDLNNGDGHHNNVITEGKKAKFGVPIHQLLNLKEYINKYNIKITGLHSHRGSGIQDYTSWVNTAYKLKEIAENFKTIEWLDLGGGFGIDDEDPINFINLNNELEKLNIKQDIFIEPGRFLVSEGGILVSKVNQIKKKENFTYIGINTGMNSLLRPSLYGAYHKIHNISKINEARNNIYNIVGPICETGDIIGSNRLLPITEIDDIILIENTGAYGHVMSSNYNMRMPAEEIII
ncbi:Amino acid kinase family [seawater metagenome]|uniref:aspartate kinase n=1 Tax=seawater metagenome TaxID=1561972 RepID=A0A5E8CM42_9ZZZZ